MSSDLREAASVIDRNVVESPQMLGKECISCNAVLAYNFFRRDSSYRDGRRDQCDLCASAPRLSTEEHFYRMREINNNSDAVKAQRWSNQSDYRGTASRVGRGMMSGAFLRVLRHLVPDLYLMDGRVAGDIAIFQTSGKGRPDWGGRSYKYIGYCPTGFLPEFSQYEFDEIRDIAIKEKQRGWRTVLLRIIEAGLLSEEDADKVFGRPDGPASVVWHRHMFNLRNRKSA